jgi:hypothetical protein
VQDILESIFEENQVPESDSEKEQTWTERQTAD